MARQALDDDPFAWIRRQLLGVESRLMTAKAAAASIVRANPDDAEAYAMLERIERMLDGIGGIGQALDEDE